MAEKKKPAKMANRNVGAEAIKDDGDKYAVVRDGLRVYGGGGVALGEAVRLATSLAAGAGIAKRRERVPHRRHGQRRRRVRRLRARRRLRVH